MAGAISNPLLRLAQFFQEAREQAGIVIVPESLRKNIEAYLHLPQHVTLGDVKAIIEAIDHISADGKEALYLRLDTWSSAIICGILKRSEDCLAYQRGLCLLTESLHENALSSQSQRALRPKKKLALGSILLPSLFRSFTNSEKSEYARRWVGSLMLELVRDCEENKVRLCQDAETNWRALGGIIIHGKSHVLRFVAGSMIREMLASGLAVENLWPEPAEMHMFAGFPKSQHHTAAWVTDFEVFINNLNSQHVLTYGGSDVFFAHAVLVQEAEGTAVRYSTNNELAILVTKSEDLVILLPASENGPAIYIDVPIKYINHATVATLEESSQLSPVMDRTVVALSIQMSPILESSSYINAVQRRTKSIEIAFDNIAAAQSVKKSLAAGTDRDIEHMRASQSAYNIDVSQPNDDQTDDSAAPDSNIADIEHLREPAPSAGDLLLKDRSFKHPPISQSEKGIDISQLQVNEISISNGFLKGPEDLITTASQANSLLPLRTPLELSNSRQLRATDTEQSELLYWRGTQPVVTNGPLSALDCQMASVSPGIPVHLGSIAVEGMSCQPVEQFEDASEAGLRSSAQWRNGKQLIERAPEYENLPTEQDNQHHILEEQRRKVDSSFLLQNDDHNSLYDASPKAPQGEPQPAKQSVERIPKHSNQEKLVKGVPKSNPSSKPGETLSKKLTKRMRNEDGEVATETPPKNAKTPQTLKKTSSRGKMPDVGNGNAGGKVQSKRRQGKQQHWASKITADQNTTIKAFNEFDVPNSPPRRKSHQQPVLKASTTTQNTTKPHSETEKSSVPSKIPTPSMFSSSTRHTQAKNARNPQPNPDAKGANAVDWDEDLNVDNMETGGSSHPGKRKAAKKKTASTAKGKSPKFTKANSAKKRAMTGKLNTSPLHQPRARRAAALTANKKIQGIAESGASETEELLITHPSKHNGKTCMDREKEPLRTSESLGAHGSPGSVGKKNAPTVTPNTSVDNQQPENQVRSVSQPQEQAKPLASKGDPRTSPSDGIVLVDHSESFQRAVDMKQGTLQRDDLGTTSYVFNGEPTAEKNVPVVALHENTDIGDLGFLAIEDSHFHDAIAFSFNLKSPNHEDNGPNSAIDNTDKAICGSELSHVTIHNKSLETTDKIVKRSMPNSRELWGSKLAGALVTVPKVLAVESPQSVRKIAKQDRTQHVSHNTSKTGASGLTSKAIQSWGSTRGVLPTSSPHRVGHHKRAKEPTLEAIQADVAEVRNHKDQNQAPVPTEIQALAADAPYASPAISTAMRPSMTQTSEVVQVSSGVEDSSDENTTYDPEVTIATMVNQIQTVTHAAQDGLDMSRTADIKSQELTTKAVESITKLRPEQRKREAENVRQRSSKAVTNASLKPNYGGIETHQRTPDPKRKSNLISFSVQGPRNQGIASSQRLATLESNEDHNSHAIRPKTRESYKLEHENGDIAEVHPEDPTLVETYIMAPTGGDPAQGTAPEHGEWRVGKLPSLLRKAITITTRDEVSVISPDEEGNLPREHNIDDNELIGENPGVVPVETAPTLVAQPFVRLADMGYDSGVESRRHEDEVSRRTLSAVPVRLPNAALIRLSRRPSLVISQSIDAAPREIKRQADEFGVEVLNDIALGKRRKLSPKVPVAEKIVPVPVPKPSGLVERDSSQRTGSQSIRVNEKGSPLPFVHSRETDIEGSQPRLTQDIVRLPTTARLIDKRNEPTLPKTDIEVDETKTTFRQGSRARLSEKWPLGSSGNSKLLPSSPNASSSIVDELEPHHIHPSGKFINVETENVVTTHEPPDPFVGATKGQSNTFMEALRRTSDRPEESLGKGPKVVDANVRKASRVITYGGDKDEDEEDLERTLVEQDSQGEDSETASGTSSQSPHSNNRPPSGGNSNSSDQHKEKNEWQKALQPHQGNTLDVLYDVSHHLVRHLVSKETAVQDLVNDYKRGGERLISEFEKARKQELDTYQGRTRESKRKLAALYKGAEEEMVRELKEVKKRPVKEYEKNWQEHRKAQKARLEAALEASGE